MGSEWRAVRLGDLARIEHGWPFQSELFSHELSGRPIVVGIGNFNYSGGFRFDTTALKEYRGEYPAAFDLHPGDILLVMTCQTAGGEILGIPARVPDDRRRYLHNQRLGKLVVTNPSLVCAEFLYWLFLTRQFNRHLVDTATGTKILHTAPSRIESFEFLLPPLPEQRRIASMLDALDDKIELNRRMSQTLESMARALFKSWFVDFDPVRAKSESRDAGLPRQLADLFPGCWDDTEIGPAPVGWHVAPLSALCTPMVGGDWGDDVRSDRSPTAVRCLRGVDLHALRASGWSKVPVRYISESSAQKRNLQPSDVIIEASGECGRSLACSEALLSYFGQPIIYSNFCRRMRTESPAAAFFVEHVLNELVRSGEMKTYVTGTAMPNLDVSGLLNSVTIAVPPTQILEAWAQLADVARRVRLSAESRALANVKDLLLPSLMCGQPTCAA